MQLASVDEALAELRHGRFVILVDDGSYARKADLIVAADRVSAASIAFMATQARGLVCVAMCGARLDTLELPLMVAADSGVSDRRIPFTVSVEARRGVSTGISAADRATTIRALIDPATGPLDLARPGHVFPLRADDGGVLGVPGQAEGAQDLLRLAGMYPAAVTCEIMDDQGALAEGAVLERFAARHHLKIVSVRQVIEHRRRHESLVHRVSEQRLATRYGEFTAIVYRSSFLREEQIALVLGDVTSLRPVLAHVHDECVTGDLLGSLDCDCGDERRVALERIAAAGRGVFVYARQEGRGLGRHSATRAELSTLETDRHQGQTIAKSAIGIRGQIFRDLGIRRIHLLTNHPRRIAELEHPGVEIVERLPLSTLGLHDDARFTTALLRLGGFGAPSPALPGERGELPFQSGWITLHG